MTGRWREIAERLIREFGHCDFDDCGHCSEQTDAIESALADASRHGAREALERAADDYEDAEPLIGGDVAGWLRTRATQEAGDDTT